MKKNDQELVSIVVPVYNAAAFLDETIKTVQDQTYVNWELIFVDDGSSDDSISIIKRYQKKEFRIKLLSMGKNTGAALARNKGTASAKGSFLAFLDADDLWDKTKLQKQLAFMRKNNYAFSFTGYEFTDVNGAASGKRVHVPNSLTYRQALKNTTISTITVMFDLRKISRNKLYMPNIKSEDTATWWSILKDGTMAYGLNEILSYYRRSAGTLSANKLTAVRRTWTLYRKHQKLSLSYSLYCFCWYVFNATARRV
jgi:teichuronic acid biosynthesis glycosyltransferase TuaG